MFVVDGGKVGAQLGNAASGFFDLGGLCELDAMAMVGLMHITVPLHLLFLARSLVA